MGSGNIYAEYHALRVRRRNLYLLSLAALAGLISSLVRGAIDPTEPSVVQPVFVRIDSVLTTWTFGIWHIVPPFQLRHPLALSNVFAYVFLALLVGTVVVRNQAQSKLNDHTRAQQDVEQDRLRDRYRDGR